MSIWLFIFYSGLSIIWSAEKWPAYYLWLHWLEGAALFLVLIRSKIEAQKILWALSLSGAIQAIMAIGQFLAQSVPANKWLGIAAHSAGSLGEMTLIAGGERWLRAAACLFRFLRAPPFAILALEDRRDASGVEIADTPGLYDHALE